MGSLDYDLKKADWRAWMGMTMLSLPALIVAMDVFVLLLALPELSSDLKLSQTQQLWVVDIYSFMLSGFLVVMGNIGDRIGRRRLLLFGSSAFGIASLLCAFSTNAFMLIAGRALLGIAGATLAPSTLALIRNMFHDATQRSIAIGIWLTCFISGAILGPLIGGVMLEHFWWGSVFLLGVPPMMILLLLTPYLLPEFRSTQSGRLDSSSVILSLASVLPVIYGFKELAIHKLGLLPIASIGFGLLCGIQFVMRQQKLENPLIDLKLFHNRTFSTSVLGMFIAPMLMGGAMLFTTQYLLLIRALLPQQASLWLMPAALGQIVCFLLVPQLVRRIRPAYLILIGLMISFAGFLFLLDIESGSALSHIAISYALINFGASPLVALSTDIIIGAAPPQKAGSAASIGQSSSEFGIAFGFASFGSIGAAVYAHRLESIHNPDIPVASIIASKDSLANAGLVAQELPRSVGSALLGAAREASIDGMHVMGAIAAIVLLTVAGILTFRLRHVPPTNREQAVNYTNLEQDHSAVEKGDTL